MKNTVYHYKRYIAAVLVGILILSLVSCGNKKEDSYSSPNFSEKKDKKYSEEMSSETDASITDAIMKGGIKATMSDASSTDAVTEVLPASIDDAGEMGMYEGNSYYNTLAGFKVTVDNETWKFYDAEGVASVTDSTPDEINNLWHGYRSPKDKEVSYGAIIYNTKDGSNIIISYVNPTAYLMPDYNSESFLKMVSSRYENYSLTKVTFLKKKYMCLDVKEEAEVGRRTQFAIDNDGLIVLITFTLQEGTKLEDAIRLFDPIEY
ncbi:hypothetical protein SAMN06297422_103137 [Lachnospiraceae bacterium]|nr:hypothetical protein SAMN06297422_103137 [Lachnospiraceae bacterium]